MQNYYHFKLKKYTICFVLALMVVFTACNKLENNTDIQSSTIEDEKSSYSNIFSNGDVKLAGMDLDKFKQIVGEPLNEDRKYSEYYRTDFIKLEYSFGNVLFREYKKYNTSDYILCRLEIINDDVAIGENVRVGDDLDYLISKSKSISDFLENNIDGLILTNEIKPQIINGSNDELCVGYSCVLDEANGMRLQFIINDNKISYIDLEL